VEDDDGITWGQLRRMSIGELRATALMEPGDDEPVTSEVLQVELERRERERMIGQIRTIVVIALVSLIVLAIAMILIVLMVLSTPRYMF